MSIIPVFTSIIGNSELNSVNSRELHEFLGSKQDYSTWVKSRLDDLGAIENIDYVIHKFMDNPKGGRPTVDYVITLDTAKHLAMMERNDKGREARQYFIEVEKSYREQNTTKLLSPMELMELQFKAHKELEHRVTQNDEKLNTLINDSALTARDEFRYQQAVKAKVEELLQTNALPQTERGRLFATIHNDIKRHYEVSSYKDLPHYRIDECIERVSAAKLRRI